MNTSEYIVKYLEDIGVEHIFTVAGGGCIFLDDAVRRSSIKPIFCLHEQAAAIAAEAYSQCGKLGVVLVTTGPGVTNTLTGVAGAYLESTPLLVISGQVNSFHSASRHGTRQFGFQEVDTEALVKPVVKEYVKLPTYASFCFESLNECLDILLSKSKSGRPGPVWLDVPLDVQNTADYQTTKPVATTEAWATDAMQKNMLEAISKAKKPVILIGNGVRLAGMKEVCLELINKLQIPTLCTWKTFDFFTQDDPLYMGRPGIVASRYANKIQQECDLLITLGARLDMGQVAFQYKNFVPKAKKIICDIDYKELVKCRTEGMTNTTLCNCDLNTFLPATLEKCPEKVPQSREAWLKYCTQLKYQYNLKTEHSKNPNFNYYKVLRHIEKGLESGEHVVVHGSSGSCSEMTCQALELNTPGRVVGTHGLGSMGFGLPAAIGAHYATGKKILCIEGDGSLAMNLQELELLYRYQLPICVLVLNNGGYASIKNTQDKLFNGKYFGSGPSSGLTLPDYHEIAKAFNLPYLHYSGSYIKPLRYLPQVMQSDGPTICEVFLDEKDTVSYPRTKTALVDGKMTTLPMEELQP